uniref:Homeobox domain-containing protein n=1 Tax=Panagrolaimus davidi TaxID=227884 RepID=A0A914PSD9_9BILA
MDSSNAMNINILQQFSQLLFLQSMASGKPLNSMNPAMFGFPQPQQYFQQPDVIHVSRESAKPLQEWMNQHINNPYPTHSDVQKLSLQTGFSFKQIRNWFTNNRHRYEQSLGSKPLPWIKNDSPNSKKIWKSEPSTEILSALLLK